MKFRNKTFFQISPNWFTFLVNINYNNWVYSAELSFNNATKHDMFCR